MSELNNFSIGALVGTAVVGIAYLIGKACGTAYQFQPKNEYLSTPEREMLLRSLYAKNFANIENRLSNESMRAFRKDNPAIGRAKAIHTVSMFESITNVEPMAFVAKEKFGEKWKKIESAISKIKTELDSENSNLKIACNLADENEALLRKITTDSHALLARAEEKLLLDAVTECMSALKYKVNSNGPCLLASKESLSVPVSVPVSVRAKVGEGRLNLNTKSFPGISCHAEVQNIEKELRSRGLVLQRLCENTLNLRKDNVRLTDPFPACPSEKQNSDNQIQMQNSSTQKARDQNRMSNTSVQRILQHRNRSLIKEKLS
jgi:hypothetical protein